MRAFIALDLSPSVRDELGELIQVLSSVRRQVKWVKPDQIHVTLKFLGEIEEETLPPILGAVSGTLSTYRPFIMRVRGVGAFGPGDRIRVIWAGIEEASGSLALVQRSIEKAVEPLGFPPEERPFKPHLTLGRLRDPIRDPGLSAALAERSGFDGGSFSVDRIVLYSSTLTPAGPIYRAVHPWPLEKAP
jgi:RNA 2',3'-cyclic 3'-phosphodiesterase